MKFGQKLKRAERNFSDIQQLDQLKFVSYKELKKLLKNTLLYYNEWHNVTFTSDISQKLYLESASKFMGVLCQDILEIAWVYDSHLKFVEPEKRCYLQAYAFLNTEAVRKICKKFDKHVPGENILATMMERLQTQGFYADIQSLGIDEVEALQKLLAGEGFEDTAFPWVTSFVKSTASTSRDAVDSSSIASDLSPDECDIAARHVAAPATMERLYPTRTMHEPPIDVPPVPYKMPPMPLHQMPEKPWCKSDPAFSTPHPVAMPVQYPIIPGHGCAPPETSAPFMSAKPSWEFTAEHRSDDMYGHSSKPDPAEPWDIARGVPSTADRNLIPFPEEDTNDVGNLIVNYLPNDWTESDLMHHFTPFGPIFSARIIRERLTRKSKGFGFVKFIDDASAERAIRGMNGTYVARKRLKVAFAKPRKSKMGNLFVARFPSDWTAVALEKLFAPYGNIIECRVLRTSEGESKRCGFVRFDDENAAFQAIINLNNCMVVKSRIRVKLADRERYNQMKNAKMDWDDYDFSATY